MDRTGAIAALRASAHDIAPGQRVEAGPFRPEDAPGVGRLFLQVYGEDYPVDDPYVPELLIEANRNGRIHTVVARTPDGLVAGQAAVYQSSPPNRRMHEFGQMLVDKDYRNSFAAFRIFDYVRKHVFGKQPGVDALFGEAVCHHLATQKMSSSTAHFIAAAELGLMREAIYAGEGAVGRVSCLLFVRVDRDQPGDLFLPECWEAETRSILPNWPLERKISTARADHASADDAMTDMAVQQFGFTGVTRCMVAEIGADFAERADQELRESQELGHELVQFFLPLGSPSSGYAAHALRQAGCFFGGFLPLWFGSAGQGPDALLVQRFLKPVRLAQIKTLNEDVARVADLSLADMERAGREFGAPVGAIAPGGAEPSGD